MPLKSEEFISIAEAATYLETTETRVLMMLKKLELVGWLHDDGWHIEKKSLQLCGKPKPSDFIKIGCGRACSGCSAH